MGEAGDPARQRAQHVAVVQRHLNRLVAVLVVHVVDDIKGIDIGLGQPVHHLIKTAHHFVVIQHLTRDWLKLQVRSARR